MITDQIALLAADLYVADIIIKGTLKYHTIYELNKNNIISSHRDMYFEYDKVSQMIFDNQVQNKKQKRFKSLPVPDRHEYLAKAHDAFKKNIKSVSIEEEEYPDALRTHSGMPIILFYKGDISILNQKHKKVAVVGSRQASAYGLNATKDIVSRLIEADTIIISGLARGIDAKAHQTALEKDGKTIAVLACGPDIIYPKENTHIYNQIEKHGIIISEMPPGHGAIPQYFPARNRIMSALSDTVAIIQAGQKSGTLHTAAFALGQGKDVFVLPGCIYDNAFQGNLELLRDGADILLEAEDILARISGLAHAREYIEFCKNTRIETIQKLARNNSSTLTPADYAVVIADALSCGEMTPDEISEKTGIPFPTIAPILSEMLLSGIVSEKHHRFFLTFMPSSSI